MGDDSCPDAPDAEDEAQAEVRAVCKLDERQFGVGDDVEYDVDACDAAQHAFENAG